MPWREKQLTRLKVLEQDFRAAFIHELEETVRTGAFFAYVLRERLPYQREGWFAARASDHLLQQVEEIEKTRQSLGMSTAGSIAEQYRRFCASLNETENEQRLGPKRQAHQVLDELCVGDDFSD